MVMFRPDQLVRVEEEGELYGANGIVRLVETDGSAWVEITNKGSKYSLDKINGYTVRGKCVLLWPEGCKPL